MCQSKEEANHWVELLRKHMPHRSNAASVNQKVSPSQAEIVPQPPPHVSISYVQLLFLLNLTTYSLYLIRHVVTR